ncbi:MAG TPA: RNA-protein complex protein Nop10 [Candidatus Methanofastidiosa archaeon]|nr:RNA-protein complex protein Nop10 [Candidatus Methanofastidiosa archaeon]HPR42420.1 RNA-protein complex protein Nop10 [Candidatus Methanofastidiosa archaeon]
MKMKILKCSSCGEYTLHDECPKCGGRAVPVRPPRFSPEDKYAEYRRRWKSEKDSM